MPKGLMIAFMFIANGDPTQRAVTNTDRGGRKGCIAAQILGKNLQGTQTDISESKQQKFRYKRLTYNYKYKDIDNRI